MTYTKNTDDRTILFIQSMIDMFCPGHKSNKYLFYDIPNTMFGSVQAIVNKKIKATIYLINAESVREKIESIIKGTKVKVIFKDVH